MTSCIDTACLLDTNFDVDEAYFSLPRHGMDEESFNALFQHLLVVEGGSDQLDAAYERYCNDVAYENGLRDALHRTRLVACSKSTMRGYALLMCFWKNPAFSEEPDLDATVIQDAFFHVCRTQPASVRSSITGGSV
ncbi:hypothetical protein [Sinorhizobium meliloti]|uniref:hypothetical protein n=1 Tax=Rhizobium meliloti TaxID=382 RepID=UPI000FDAA4C8|nr:hypothetical protein [Sinorhizobium meliloti]RVK27333.1 hypothetical protein CN163_30940 [Sinorhizobium meliloti]